MKTRNEFIISTHMAGTWTSEGITKGLSVWTGMTVAKSQTHTAHTIRCVCCNQRRGRVEVLTGDHFKCGLYRRRTGTTFKCSRTHKYFDFPLRRLRFLAFRSEFAVAFGREEPRLHAARHTSNRTVSFFSLSFRP